MIKSILFTLILFGASLAHAQAGVQFSWTGNGNAGMPPCSASVTSSCLTTYTLTDITNLATPIVISSTISASATSYTQNPLPSVGAHTWSLVVNGKDQSGNAVSSPAVTVTLIVPSLKLNAPTGFSGTAQ